MNKTNEQSAAAQDYAAAYASHYTDRNLLVALRSYESILALHPGAPEAEYSRAQIRNIVNLVVPAGETLTAQIELVHRHLETDGDESTKAVSP